MCSRQRKPVLFAPFYFIIAGHAKKGDIKSRAMSCLELRACNDIEILKGGGGGGGVMEKGK